ncbi:unnamed protein product [Commensalibacter communis]|uniref:Leucine-rich repeat domain-containing protein n=1 Tax=Commensalibacter communis TaxID=2972786 RepID=A0A9W4TPG3_9PROT|nr:hypothetical protein [Commensalibacter communis]CAI3938656.1 unnamed protein product [Commensalibacter communis]CAI3941671.1 unnamed protein product [Commensalibacter communis]CAI3944825.1 unnamed protein product [Commensalibacter communis]CAI3944957.1 unnamed protein product [Commensalibacter communis]
MSSFREFNLKLTSGKMVQFRPVSGQGSCSIGIKGISKGNYDILLEEDVLVNWDAFNDLFTPAAEDQPEEYPYGNFPRFFYYAGNDIGFVEWSKKRKIEEFNWCPYDDVVIDLANAQISNLSIDSAGNKIELRNAHQIRSLSLSGNIETIHIVNPEAIKSIDISSGANIIFNCEYLLPFINLKSLNLNGNVSNLHALKELTQIESLGLRYMPDLSGMPSLTSWTKLRRFIAYVVEEKQGKLLRAELKQLIKEEKLPDTENNFFSVSKLKSKLWFMGEGNNFFASWSDKNEKKASKAYKLAVKEVSNAKAEKQVKEAVLKLIKIINILSNIETTEREDTWFAVQQLVKECHFDISEDLAMEWFDGARDF